MFNAGVELGQIAFDVLVFAMLWSWRTLHVQFPKWAMAIPGYTVGTLGAFWTWQRLALLL
jgi:hypothetical protein